MEHNIDPELPKFIRDSIARRNGVDPSQGEKIIPTSDFEGPTPDHVKKAIGREETAAQTLQGQQTTLAKNLASQGASYKEAKRLLVPVNEAKLGHHRLAGQIKSEFEVK